MTLPKREHFVPAFTGAASIRHRARSSGTVRIGEVEFEQATGIGHLRHDFADLADGDLIEVTAGEWPGMVFRVVEALRGDQQTARRFPVEETSRPQEWQ